MTSSNSNIFPSKAFNQKINKNIPKKFTEIGSQSYEKRAKKKNQINKRKKKSHHHQEKQQQQ